MAYPWKKILSPSQFDDPAMVAIALAGQLARMYKATVYLLHVVPILPAIGEPETGVTAHSHAEEEALRTLEEMAASALGGVKYKILTRVAGPGLTAKAIVEAAKEEDIDIIVMKTHGRHGLAHLILGSVAEEIVREAHCPVLTLTSEAKERHA